MTQRAKYRYHHLFKSNTYIDQLVQRLASFNTIQLFIGFLVLNLGFQLLISFIFPADFQHPVMKLTPWKRYLLGALVVPVLETCVYQVLLQRLVLKKMKKLKIYAILISAVVFGLMHDFSKFYVASAFFGGILLAMLYYIAKEKRQAPVVYVSLIHCCYNFLLMSFANL
jgi:membrane protease YdiL (CAAX protease family)